MKLTHAQIKEMAGYAVRWDKDQPSYTEVYIQGFSEGACERNKDLSTKAKNTCDEDLKKCKKVLKKCKVAMDYAFEDHVDRYYLNVKEDIEKCLKEVFGALTVLAQGFPVRCQICQRLIEDGDLFYRHPSHGYICEHCPEFSEGPVEITKATEDEAK